MADETYLTFASFSNSFHFSVALGLWRFTAAAQGCAAVTHSLSVQLACINQYSVDGMAFHFIDTTLVSV